MIRGVRNVRLRPIVAMRAIHVVHNLAGRGVDHHGIAIGRPVFVDGGPRIVGNGTDLLDLARWSGGGRHGAACRADGFGREGATRRRLRHGRGIAGEIIGGRSRGAIHR